MLRRFNRPPLRKQKSVTRRPLRPRLLVEALEDRCVPASTATVSGGVLTINGDTTATAQNITIAEVANSPGTYAVTVTDNGTTNVNFTQGGITSIVINPTNGGADTVNLNGSTTTGTTLTGNLTINANPNGALTVDIGKGSAGFNVNGTTTINDSSSSQTLTVLVQGSGTSLNATNITTSNIGSNITFDAGAAVLGALNITGGLGSDTVTLGDTAVGGGAVTVNAPITMNLQGGTNILNSTNSTLGALTLTSADQLNLTSDTVTSNILSTNGGPTEFSNLTTTTVQGFVSINGKGVTGQQVSINGSTINGFLSVVGSDAASNITMFSSSVGGNTAFDLGAPPVSPANETVTLNGSFGGSVLVLGTGNLDFTMGTSTATNVSGFVSLNETGSSSVDTVTIGATGIAVNIGGFLSNVASGTSNVLNTDAMTLTDVTTGGAFGAAMGSGIVTADIEGSNIGGNVFINGTGNLNLSIDTVSTTATNISGFVTLNQTGSASVDTVLVGSTGAVNVGGFFSVVATGTGNLTVDAITINDTVLGDSFGTELSGANDSVTLASTSAVKMTSGGVIVDTTSGNLTLNVGSTTAGVSAPGNLTLSTGASNYTATVTDSTLGGAKITGTGGTEDLIFDDVNFTGAVTISQGSGNDTFTVETGTDTVPSQFFGAVTYTSSSTNDTVNLGASTTDLAIFFSSASFTSAGAATDSISFKTNAQFNGGAPTITGFGTQT
jgi:fibronectin-binding autotransporter adhesin